MQVENTVATHSHQGFAGEEYWKTVSLKRGAFSVNDFCEWAGIGRSKFYAEVKEGRLILSKAGNKSLVTGPNAVSWVNNLREAA